MSEQRIGCAECGMEVTLAEYHPYAACLMFKACHNSETVRANLDAVIERGKSLITPATSAPTTKDTGGEG